MSVQRSASGIRELRARFESQSSDERNLSPLRGQSPIDNTSSASRSPVGRQRVRTSFVSVEPSGQQAGKMASNTERKHDGSISTAERRSSFSMADDPEAVNELKKTVSNEAERRKNMQDSPISETAVSSALPTPIPEAPEPASPGLMAPASARPSGKGMSSSSSLKGFTVPEVETQSEHQEKSVSAVEDQEAEMRPSDVKSVEAVSGGKADGQHPAPQLDGQTEEGQVETAVPMGKATTKPSKPQTASKASASRPSASNSSQKPSTPVTNGVRSTSAGKSATAGTAASTNRTRQSTQFQKTSPDRKRTKPVPLPSHLTAPTASSKAKHEPDPSGGCRVTSGSGPLQSTSHLMAPTAASKAKHDPEASPSSSTGSSTSARPAPSAAAKKDRTSMVSTAGTAPSRKPAARPSIMGRSNGAPSRQPKLNGTKPPAPNRTAAPGFLDRMTKPTAASSNKTHDKTVSDDLPAHTKPTAKPATTQKKPLTNGTGPSGPAKPKNIAAAAQQQQPAKGVGVKPAMSVQTTSSKSSTKSSSSVTKTPSPTVPRTQKKNDSKAPNGAPVGSSPSQARKTSKPATPAKGQSHPPQPPRAPQQISSTTNMDGQQDNQPTQWNAAALPLTPQSQKKNDPFNANAIPTAELPNGTAATTKVTAKKTADMAIRRSMMETPEVEEETIR